MSKMNKLRNEYLGKAFATFCGILIVVLTFSMIAFLTIKGMRTFTKDGFSILDFLFSTQWRPDAEVPKLGARIFITGSTMVSLGAVALAAPVSMALAIFMHYISPKFGKMVLQPALELFVGIPSVVYGWLGFSVLLPFIRRNFGGVGFSLLAGIMVLSIMILPTMASISADAVKTVPRDFVEASYGLGATRWQTISKVIVPAAKNGMLTGVVLGLARAFGEALAVQMVIGNSIKLADGLVSPTSTLTSMLTMDMGNTMNGTAWNDALWSMAFLLLVLSFVFILMIRAIGKRGEMK